MANTQPSLRLFVASWLVWIVTYSVHASDPLETNHFNFADDQTVIVEVRADDGRNAYSASLLNANGKTQLWTYRAGQGHPPLRNFGCIAGEEHDFILSFIVNYTDDSRGLFYEADERIDFQDAVLYVEDINAQKLESEETQPPGQFKVTPINGGYSLNADGTKTFHGNYDGRCALMHIVHRDLGEELFKEVRGFPPQWESTSATDHAVEIVLTIRQRRFKYWHRLNTDEWKVTLLAKK
ncbi:MAG: hypothetical protein R3C18_09930 [Planctomycetaceae bacterium]